MPEFLTLNGVPVRCSFSTGGSRTTIYMGGSSRSFNGQLRGGPRTQKREWRFATVPMPLAESEALQGIIEGRGQHWTFEVDGFSDGGLATRTAVAPLYGSGPGSLLNHGKYAYLDGFTSELTWQLSPSTDWTLLGSAFLANTAETEVWRRVVRRSDGAIWHGQSATPIRQDAFDLRTLTFDGATGILTFRPKNFGGTAWSATQVRSLGSITEGTGGNDHAFQCTVAGTTGAVAPVWPSTAGATVTDGSVTWTCIGRRYGYCGDLALLPFKLPDAWVAGAYAFHQANPWSQLPALVAEGTFSPTPVSMLGQVLGAEPVHFANGGVWTSGEVVEFILREV